MGCTASIPAEHLKLKVRLNDQSIVPESNAVASTLDGKHSPEVDASIAEQLRMVDQQFSKIRDKFDNGKNENPKKSNLTTASTNLQDLSKHVGFAVSSSYSPQASSQASPLTSIPSPGADNSPPPMNLLHLSNPSISTTVPPALLSTSIPANASSVTSASNTSAPTGDAAVEPASRYEWLDTVLGKGHFAFVRLAYDKVAQQKVAIKIIAKREFIKNRAVVQSEIDILTRVGPHAHIVSLLDCFEDSSYYYLVMEYCEGGDLFSNIVENGKYTEKKAAMACNQLAEALAHIHSCSVTHRDLKPENILLYRNPNPPLPSPISYNGKTPSASSAFPSSNNNLANAISTKIQTQTQSQLSSSPASPNARKLSLGGNSFDENHLQLKVADFGLSKLLKSHKNVMRTVCGTWAYCAPEVILRQPYNQKCDIWTLGVLMYVLLCGYHPFDVFGDLAEPQLIANIVQGKYDFSDPIWDEISDEPKELIKRLLCVDPEERMSLEEYRNAPWVRGENAKELYLPTVPVRLSRFNCQTFRTLVVAKIASQKLRKSISRSRSVSRSRQKESHISISGKFEEEEKEERPDIESRQYEEKEDPINKNVIITREKGGLGGVRNAKPMQT